MWMHLFILRKEHNGNMNLRMGNLERMIGLANEFFDWKNDAGQIAVDEGVLERLREIHPATLCEEIDGDGPVAWVLVIPTTRGVMEQFLAGRFTERELLEHTSPGEQYQAIYLCSALVLPEYRRKGIAKTLTVRVIEAIRRDHRIEHLYYWAFSEGGKALGGRVAMECRLPLLLREGHSFSSP